MSDVAPAPDILSTPDVVTLLPQPLRARPIGVRAALGMGCAASVILLATMAFVGPRHDGAQHAAAETPAPLTPPPAPEKIATKIDTPAPIPQAQLPFSAFDLKAPEFAQEKKTIATRDGDDGAGRVDSITIGQFDAAATFMRIDLHQNATEKEADADFFLDMTRHAARLGLSVARINARGALQSRFGAFESADIRLTQPAGENVPASERNCVAARLVDDKTALVIASLACGSATLPIDRANLGCLLDRLDYAKGEDQRLAEFFTKADPAKAEACNAAPADLTGSLPHKSQPHAHPHPRPRRHR